MRSDIRKQRVTLVTEAMHFSADEAAKFWPIYAEYEKEFAQMGDARLALIRDYAANYETMTGSKARELAGKVLDLQEQRTSVLRKYFERIAQELSPVRAARFVQVENQINILVDLQIASQVPLIH